jgi:allantoin racemase
LPYLHLYNSLQIAKSIRRAEEQGYDAVVLGCMLQGGLKEARSLVDIPVIGTFESAAWLAAQLGRKFAILAPEESLAYGAKDLVERYGLANRVTSITGVKSRTFEMMLEDPDSYLQSLSDEIKAICEEGDAEAIIPFCTILGSLLASRRLLSSFDIPMADPVRASLKMAEDMVQLGAKLGLKVCRRSVYRKTPKSFLEKIPL